MEQFFLVPVTARNIYVAEQSLLDLLKGDDEELFQR